MHSALHSSIASAHDMWLVVSLQALRDGSVRRSQTPILTAVSVQ